MKSNISIFLTIALLTSLIFIVSKSCGAAQTTKIGGIPSAETVIVGDEFNLTIYINTTEEIGGWLLDLNFTQGMVIANNVTAGSYWTAFFDEGNVSNDLGTITDIQTWTTGPYPSVNHTACIISFLALESGVCTINIERVQATNALFDSIAVSTYYTTIIITKEDTSTNDGNDGNKVYLIDNDADGTYDSFHNDTSGQETDVEKQDDGTYLLDYDGDDSWDWIYDVETDTLTEYSGRPTIEPDYTALIVLVIIVILILIILGYLVKLSNDKKKAQK